MTGAKVFRSGHTDATASVARPMRAWLPWLYPIPF